MAALNKKKVARIEEISRELERIGPCSSLQLELAHRRSKLVRELLQDLKHFSSRIIATLTCGEANREQFHALCARIKGIFRVFCPARDADIGARLTTPGDSVCECVSECMCMTHDP